MGISIQEFKTAMETYGAILIDRPASNYVNVPCFKVKDVEFLHSGSNYIVQRGNKVPEEIMNMAMAALGEKCPGGDNFWRGETHSVKGILTLVSMLENKYSTELVEKLTNETYKRLFACQLIQGDIKIPFQKLPLSSMKKLRQLLLHYDAVVNPFGNSNVTLIEPIQYMNKVKVALAFGGDCAHLYLSTPCFGTKFFNTSNGVSYQTSGLNDEKKGKDSGYTDIVHYYNSASDSSDVDEVVALSYTTGGGYCYYGRPGDVDLRISMKTGLAWKTYYEGEAEIVTGKQLYIMITHLKNSIAKVQKIIVNNMVKK